MKRGVHVLSLSSDTPPLSRTATASSIASAPIFASGRPTHHAGTGAEEGAKEVNGKRKEEEGGAHNHPSSSSHIDESYIDLNILDL